MTEYQNLPVGKKLIQLAKQKKTQHMNTLFVQDSERFTKFAVELPKLLLY